MITVPLAQAKNQLSELITRVESGETVAVTRRGKTVARLVGCRDVGDVDQSDQVGQVFAKLAQLRRGVVLDGDLQTIARQGQD